MIVVGLGNCSDYAPGGQPDALLALPNWEKHLRLVIVGRITPDCRSGQADTMSEAFLQMEQLSEKT